MRRNLQAFVLVLGLLAPGIGQAAAHGEGSPPVVPVGSVNGGPQPPTATGDRWSPETGAEDLPPGAPTSEPTSVVVELAAGAASATTMARDVGGEVVDRIPGTAYVVIDVRGRDATEVSDELVRRPGVLAAEPNGIVRAFSVPNDPLYAQQEPAMDQIRLEEAWNLETGSPGVVVAVLDTGVDPDHPDLSGRLVSGWNTITNTNATADDFGHGTMVAGIIAARRDNAVGIAGVAGGGVQVMPVKVLDSLGNGTDADVAEGIYWAADHGAEVINLSLGRLGTSSLVASAVDHARSQNVVVVAATGNAGINAPSTPAGEVGVLGVAASDAGGHFAWFSTYGGQVDLTAPGMGIVSTTDGGGYGAGDGTSFAAPLVAGVAALVRSRHPGWGEERVRVELTRSAEDRGSAGVDESYGYGVLDAAAALGVRGREPLVGVAAAAVDTEPNDVPDRATTAQSTNTGTLAVEGDVDWWRIPIGTTSSVTITITPAPVDQARAANFDPVLAVHRADSSLVATVDDFGAGEAESITFTADPGAQLVGISNYLGSTSAGTYDLTITGGLSPIPVAATPVSTTGPWVKDTAPAARTAVAAPATVSVTFGRPVQSSTVNQGTVVLLDAVTGYLYPSTVTFSDASNKATITPALDIPDGSPLLIGVGGVRDAGGALMDPLYVPFTTTGKAFPTPVLGGDFDVLAGDFNGDGPTDAFLYQAGTSPDLTLLGAWEGFYEYSSPVSGTYEPFALDFNGDGYDDIVWYRPGTGPDSIWYGNANGFTSTPTTIDGAYQPFTLDFNGDGYDDIVWYSPGAGPDSIWYGNASGFTGTPTTINGSYQPVAGDFNGDGYDDITWYVAGLAQDSVWWGTIGGFTSTSVSIDGTYEPAAGDFNGDLFDDILFYGPGAAPDSMAFGGLDGHLP